MTKHGMQLALLIGSPLGGLEGVERDVDRMATRLEARGFECTRCVGEDATRARILARLEALRDAAQPGHAIVVYYSGHGGRCHLEGGSARAHNYLVPMDHDRERRFRGVADFELALIFHDISTKTRNVTVILDCCHASTMVRSDQRGELFRSEPGFEPQPQERVRRWSGGARYPMPEDMRVRLAQFEARAGELHHDSNPRVVRIVATASGSPAFEFRQGDVCGGYLTDELCSVLDEGLDASMSWDSIVRRARESIIRRRGSTTQRPELEGPLHRLPFSLETVTDLVGRSTLVYKQTDRSPWVRAGRLHGLSVGDELEVLDERTRITQGGGGDSHEASVMAMAEVVELFDDSARVELRQRSDAPGGHDGPPGGSVAVLTSAGLRREVWLDESARTLDGLHRELGRNVRLWVTEAREDAMFHVRRHGDELRLEGPPWLRRVARSADAEGIARLLSDLDDVARGSILEEVLASPAGLPNDVEWSVQALVRPPGERTHRRLIDGERVPVGTGVRFELAHRTRARPPLYVNVLDRGVSGRIELLNPSQPAGVQLRAPEGPRPTVEWVPGSTMALQAVWPADVPKVPGSSEEYIFVVSERPLDLRSLLKLDASMQGQGSSEWDCDNARSTGDGARETKLVVEPLADTHPDTELGSELRWAVKRVSLVLVP